MKWGHLKKRFSPKDIIVLSHLYFLQIWSIMLFSAGHCWLLTWLLLDQTWQGADVVACKLTRDRPVLVVARVGKHRAHQGDAGCEEGKCDADQRPLRLLRGELPLPPVHDVHPQPPDVLLALLQVGHCTPVVHHLCVKRLQTVKLSQLGEACKLYAGAEVGGNVNEGAGDASDQRHFRTVGT